MSSANSGAGLRNEQIRIAFDEAVTRGDGRFFSLLSRFGGLPGPRPNVDLALAAGDLVVSRGAASEPLLRQMLALDEREADAKSGMIFVMQVAAQALAGRILAGFDVETSWQRLQDLAGDNRKPARDGVTVALERLAVRLGGGAVLTRLSSWTDGFLQAAVALDALGRRTVLDVITPAAVGELVARVEEATAFAEAARRADERTQGRRRLLEALSDALPPMVQRFPAMLEWFEGRVVTTQPELRAALEQAVAGMQKLGMSDELLDPTRRALDGSVAPLRDPTHYRGPTRGRGRKAQRREQRR